MDTPDLAASAPGLMAAYPACGWTLLSGLAAGEDLVLELRLLASPTRVATVRVDDGAEVFSFTFAGHVSHGFAYADEDRLETLQERIELALEAISGPTRVILEQARGATIKSTLVVDPDASNPRQDVVSYPLWRVKAFLAGSRLTREVTDFPAIAA